MKGPVWDAVHRLDLGVEPYADLFSVLSRWLRALGATASKQGSVESILTLTLNISGLPVDVCLSTQQLLSEYLPLVLLLERLVAAQGGAARGSDTGPWRILVGLVGPAGSGKTTICELLCRLFSAWHVARHAPSAASCTDAEADHSASDASCEAAADFPSTVGSGTRGQQRARVCETLSMDAFHRYNADLVACGLKQHKGRIDTIDATAFARALGLLAAGPAVPFELSKPTPESGIAGQRTVASEVAPRCSAHGAGDEGAAEALSRRDGDGIVWLPEYDRRVTHDPLPAARAVPPSVQLVLVEGLYLCNSIGGADGSQRPAGNVPVEACAGAGEAAMPAAAAGAVSVEPASPVLSPEQAASWSRVRSLLDFVIYLDVPLAVCRARVVARKAAAGVPLGEAAAYYARVDLPIYRRLRGVDRLAPGRAASTPSHCGPVSRDETTGSSPAAGGGPDVVLHYEIALASGRELVPSVALAAATAGAGTDGFGPTASLTVGAVTLNGSPWCPLTEPARDAIAQAGGAGAVEHASSTSQLPVVVVLGLNPCVQKTLVFGKPPLAGMGLAASGARPAWVRGEVNRATTSATSVGGKGQHTCIAIARAAAHATAAAAPGGSGPAADESARTLPDGHTPVGHLPPRPSVHLVQFLAGKRGSDIAGMLRASLQSLQGVTSGHQDAPGVCGRDVPEGIELHSFWSTPPDDGSTCTRTCITLVDAAAGDSTELIEPSPPVPAALVVQLLADVQHLLGSAADAGKTACLSIMGTAPPGAGEVYTQLLVWLTGGASAGVADACVPPRLLPFVLLDLSARVGPLLASGAVSMLKVNATELRALVAELPASAAHPLAARGLLVENEGRSKADGIAADALQLLLEYCRPAPPAACEAGFSCGLHMVAVTDGPHAAHLFQVAAPCSPGLGSHSSVGGYAAGPRGDVEATLAVSHWGYSLPAQLPLPVLNPIGAGDTVAGNFLFYHCCAGHPAWLAYGRALAAGSASCTTLTGALWDAGVAAAIQGGIRVRHQTLLCRR